MSGIYVETFIHGSLDELWVKTQDPALHQRWDLRFSEISYLPRPSEAEPQRFRYLTRLGFGLAIAGEGETAGQRFGQDGHATSALRFASDDPLSLIREGSGYWQYLPQADGVRFLTWYDYQTRFGLAGHLLDRLLFRPLMGWATAWSFDRLRLWIETGLDPREALKHSAAHTCALGGLMALVLYDTHIVLAHPHNHRQQVGGRLVPLLLHLVILTLTWIGLQYGRQHPAARRCRRQRPEVPHALHLRPGPRPRL